MDPCIVGVRHHSPACARRVREAIRSLKPAFVLIEGPVDMNGHLDDLLREHRLPVAIFSFLDSTEQRHASWSPFCAWSPEWVALQSARETGAEALFMDLPAWAPAFRGVENRYADPFATETSRHPVDALCQRFHIDDVDALWDHLFEQPREETDQLFEAYFQGIRAEDDAGRHAAREHHMARCMSWAVARDRGPVVVVCGGWHAPALADAWTTLPPEWPDPEPVPEGARVGSYLVPWSYHRLDAFTGYQSGMPSPAWYEALWERSAEAAANEMLRAVLDRLRRRKLPISPADAIQASVFIQTLARIRGHTQPGRTDVLDALAAALLKEAQDRPLPWTRRGPLPPGTDPVLVEIVSVFCGDRIGVLAPGTRRPPLPADVEALLHAHNLVPSKAGRPLSLDLENLAQRQKSQILHRLLLLRVPGFRRISGPVRLTEAGLTEEWMLQAAFDADSALIEAAAWGPTLEQAARARLAANLSETQDLPQLTGVLTEAVFLGLLDLSEAILARVEAAMGAEASLEDLGTALARLLVLWRAGRLVSPDERATLGRILPMAMDRGLWLAEGIQGPTASAESRRILAVQAMRDTVLYGVIRARDEAILIDPATADAVMTRRSLDPMAPPDLRGAALGFRWSTGSHASPEQAALEAVAALGRAARPETLGDFLSGLFVLARQECRTCPDLVGATDEALQGMDIGDFLVALPSLRMAFSWFPPAERADIARLLLTRHGADPRRAADLLRSPVDPQEVARAMTLELRAEERLRRFALLPLEG